jgi:hypothetical protein
MRCRALKLLLILTPIGLFFTWRPVRKHTRARDCENYLSLKEMFASAWRRLAKAEDADKSFEFTEVMNLLESA